MKKNQNSLAIQMGIGLVLGLICGCGFIFLRENLISSGSVETWNSINRLLFADITAAGNEQALGILFWEKRILQVL